MTGYNASSNMFGLGPILGTAAEDWNRTTIGTAGGRSGSSGDSGRTWAIMAGIFADLSSAYSNFNAVRLQKIQQKAQASALDYRARMQALDQRAAERQAESILAQGRAEIGRVTLEGGQRRAALEARTAASGVEASGRNAIEAQASERLMQEIDVYNINLASVQQASAARRRATDIGNQAQFDRTAAVSLRRQARAASPEAAFLGGLARNSARTGYLLAYQPS